MKTCLRLISVVFLFLCLSGCSHNSSDIVFSTTPFNQSANYKLQNTFHKGEKIYFAIYNEEGFKTKLIKVQIFKKASDKSEFGGYEYLYNKTVELDNKNYYTDYTVIHNSGYYIFRIFDYTNFLEPIITGIINVVD